MIVSAGFREGGVPGAGYERQLRLQQRELAAELNGANPFTSIDPENLA